MENIVISYPKSGRTWLRVMLAKLLKHKTKRSLRSCYKDTPYMRFTHTRDFDEDAKVIFLRRNPYDVAVSCYFEDSRRRNLYKGTISDYVRSNIVNIFVWTRTYEQFSGATVDYEDIHRDPELQLRRIVKFFGIEVEDKYYAPAVKFGTFENMRKLEKGNFFKSKSLKQRILGDPESRKVRKGKIEGYKDYLTEDDIKYMQKIWTELSFT